MLFKESAERIHLGIRVARIPFAKKNTHTVVPLDPAEAGPDWTAAGFARGRWADWLGSAMKPLMEYGKSSDSFPEAALSGHTKNPLPGGSGRPRVRL